MMFLPVQNLVFSITTLLITCMISVSVSAVYVSYYKNWRIKSKLSTCISILLLTFSFLYPLLVMVDIDFISSFKHPNGTWQEWTNGGDVVESLELKITYSYLALYGLLLVMTSLLFPFAYFSLDSFVLTEENNHFNLLRGLKFLFLVFLPVFIALLAVGAVFSNKYRSSLPLNSTLSQQIIFGNMSEPIHYVENSLMFSMSSLSVIGILVALFYTSYGMSLLPFHMMERKRKENSFTPETCRSLVAITSSIHKYTDKLEEGRPLSDRDRMQLTRYSYRLGTMVKTYEYSPSFFHDYVLRPVRVLFGFLIHLFSYGIVASLLIGSVERIRSSYGFGSGYVIRDMPTTNPVDIFFSSEYGQNCAVDYLLVMLFVILVNFSTLFGFRRIGIRFFGYKFDELIHGNTAGKTLMYTCFLLAYVTVYSMDFLQIIAPQFVQYGHQTYSNQKPWMNLTHATMTSSNFTLVIAPCSPLANADDCTMSRYATLNMRFLQHFPFFGIIQVVVPFLFTTCFVIGLVTTFTKSGLGGGRRGSKGDVGSSESLEPLIN